MTDNVIAMLQPATDLATKSDLALTASELRAEMTRLRGDLRTEMSDLRTEMSDLRTEMADLRTDVTKQIAESLQPQTRTLMFTVLGGVLLAILAMTLQGAVS